MKHILLSIRSAAFASLLSLLGACSSEFNELPVQDNPSAPLAIHVNMDGFSDELQVDTRAIDDGVHTFFQDGDCVGIIAIKSDGTTQQTVTYNATSRSWKASDSDTYDDSGATTYVPYFPYKEDLSMDNISSAETAFAAIKAAIQPKEDQRTAAAYRASDLLTGSCTYSGNTLSINLAHAYSLLWLQAGTEYSTPDDFIYRTPLSDVVVNYNDMLLYPCLSADGYRLVVDAKTSPHSIRWFYTLADGTPYLITASTLLDAGKYRLFRNITSGGLRPIKVGDYYYSNGGIVPGDTENPPAEGCIGIVSCTDVSRIGKAAVAKLKTLGVQKPHGFVMALTNASERCRWGEYNKDENSDGSDGTPFKDNTDKLNKQYNNVDGYAETHWMFDKFKNGGYNQETYKAFTVARSYNVATPDNTTGWFIPSMGQWWDILSNLGGIDLSNYQNNDRDGYTYISNAAPIAVDNINVYLGKVNGATTFSLDTYFWSSSEYSGGLACNVYFYGRGNLYLYYDFKDSTDGRVRCVLAF